MKIIKLPVPLIVFMLVACQTATVSAVESPVPSTVPTWTATLPPTSTSSPEPTLAPSLTPAPSPTSTATPRPDIAPTLPHSDVNFIYHGERDKPYIALTFDLCQKPELPSWFDQGIVDMLTQYDAPATFFMGGDWMRTHKD